MPLIIGFAVATVYGHLDVCWAKLRVDSFTIQMFRSVVGIAVKTWIRWSHLLNGMITQVGTAQLAGSTKPFCAGDFGMLRGELRRMCTEMKERDSSQLSCPSVVPWSNR